MRVKSGALAAILIAAIFSPLQPSAFALSTYASAPNNVTVTAISGGLHVSWTNPSDTATGVLSFRVETSTTGTSGTWGVSATLSNSTFATDILGLTTNAVYVRVAAITTAGIGTYGYPWTKLYKTITKTRSGTAIVYESGYGNSTGNFADSNSNLAFSRVRYLMEDTLTATYNFADVDFYKWSQGGTVATTVASSNTASPSIANLQVPSPAVPFVVQTNVSDMNVYSKVLSTTPYPNPPVNGAGINGRLELWNNNYAMTLNGLSPSGDGGTYDVEDLLNASGSYGSFQVHNMDSKKTVLAWNNHGVAYPDIGIGDGLGMATNPDWTFCGRDLNCPDVTSFALTIFVNAPTTPLADTAAPTPTLVSSYTTRNGATIIVKSTEIGTVYLVNQSVTVTSLSSITSAAANLKNSISISTVNTNTSATLFGLVDGTYNIYAVDSLGNLSSPISNSNRLDSTPPSTSAISVGSTGSTIEISVSETVTRSIFLANLYTVSDGGSAMTVTDSSATGPNITLTLSRAIIAGATVTFSYTPTNGGTSVRWIDSASNELAAIASGVIANNSIFGVSNSLSIPAILNKGVTVVITATVSVPGKVTFTVQGKRIPGCIKLSATGSTPIVVTCNWKPATANYVAVTAELVPTNTSYSSTKSATISRYITKRVTTR